MSAEFDLSLKRSVVREVARFAPKVRRQIDDKPESLRGNPRPQDSISLRNLPMSFRVDTYRILHDIDYEARQVTVWRVGHRKDVYRNL